MKTSIATVSISGTLSEKLAAVAAAGFDGVEIFENDFLTFDGSPAEVGRMVRDVRSSRRAPSLVSSRLTALLTAEGVRPSEREAAE